MIKEDGTTLTPKDLIVITYNTDVPLEPGAQPAHVGLQVEEILGQEAALAFVHFRMYTGKQFRDFTKAAEARTTFVRIAGFSPEDVLEEVNEQELEFGFTTV